ncbi:hypothetical protein D3C71_799640 [compost metagenome]
MLVDHLLGGGNGDLAGLGKLVVLESGTAQLGALVGIVVVLGRGVFGHSIVSSLGVSMPRRFKQVRRRLSAFVRVGDCRPRSVKTLVSESAYMGNSALPSGLECGGPLLREVQPLRNRCRSGLELRFEPVQPGLQAAKPWASPQSFLARVVLRSAQSMAEIRKKDRRNGLQRSFCHRRFSVRFQLQRATDRSGRYR